MNKLDQKLQKILKHVEAKYEDGGKHKASVEFDSGFIFISLEKNHNKLSNFFDVLTVGEFYQKHINWIKEIPEEHALFMAEILGQNEL